MLANAMKVEHSIRIENSDKSRFFHRTSAEEMIDAFLNRARRRQKS
jgi:hypothetical protein